MTIVEMAYEKGYLVTVPTREDGEPIFMLEGWDRRFSTSENVFFKSSETIGSQSKIST